MFTEETNVTIHKYLQIRRLTVAAENVVKPICQLYKLPMKRDIIHNKHFHWLLNKFICIHKRFIEIGGFFVPKQQKISMCKHFYSNKIIYL